MVSDKKLKQALWECYVDLYKHSDPPADFNELVKNAKKNYLGQEIIPFNDYSIDSDLMESIINDVTKKYKIKGYQLELFNQSIYLGCSPAFK